MASESLSKILAAEAAVEKSLAEAQKQAEGIIEGAKAEAERILKSFEREADERIKLMDEQKSALLKQIFEENREKTEREVAALRRAADEKRHAAVDAAIRIILGQ